MRVQARAPARVDLAGGTVDIWPLYLFHPGAQTVNIAIRSYATCVAETRPDGKVVLVSKDQGCQEAFASLAELAAGHSQLPLLRELVLFFEPHRGVTITTRSEVPAGAGLAGSSTLNIALCGALARITGKRLTRAQMLEVAKNVEAIVIRVPTGLRALLYRKITFRPCTVAPMLFTWNVMASSARNSRSPSAKSKGGSCSVIPGRRGIPPSTTGK